MLTAVHRRRGDDPLPAAVALLRREGPAALTMRNVANEAGVTATALYRHYADKDALLKAVVSAAYGEFRDWIMLPEAPANPALALNLAFDRFLHFGVQHPNLYRLLFIENHGHGIDRYPDDFVSGKSVTFRRLKSVVEAWAIAESGRPASREATADWTLSIYAHMHGMLTLYLAGRFPDKREFEAFFHRSMNLLARGILDLAKHG
jgi:AcrR family transcriptional regulator